MSSRKNFFPKVTFVIPIYNSAAFLDGCFKSIEKQNYPKNKIELICPDGGSKDSGPNIAKKFGAKVIKNTKKLAEPGFMLGAKKATGELIVFMGADNRLYEMDWIQRMTTPFHDKEIMGAYSWHRNRDDNTWFTKYFNAFTDPINAFVLGDAANIRTFKLGFPIKKREKNFVVYSFSIHKIPLLAFDQCFMIRKSYERPRETEYDDILPVIDMIEKGMDLAYVPNASNLHLTLEEGFSQFSRKMRWIIDNNLSPKPKFGFPTRKKFLTRAQRIRFYIWPFYALSVVAPIIHSCIGFLRDKRKEWIYHTPITILMLGLVVYEVVRVKLLEEKSLAERY